MAKMAYTNKSKVILHGVQPGADFDIDVDEEGTPTSFEWRRRVKDAKVDKCIEKKQVAKVAKKNTTKEELPK